MKAHPTAVVDPGASVAEDVEIGPFCIVGSGVRIGPGCRLGPHVMLQGPAVIGRNNVFHPQAKVGAADGGRIEIGDGNVFRECSHVDGPSAGAQTRIGSRNHFGVYVGIGSGSTIGNDVRMGAYATLGASCVVGDRAAIEGQCVIEQDRKIGRGSLVRSQVPVIDEDVPEFVLLDGNPARSSPRPARTDARGEGGGA